LVEKFIVIGSPNSQDLAKKVCKKLDGKFLQTKLKIFPDGENKITISGKITKRTIVVVSSSGPPVDSNLVHTFSLIAKAKEISNKVIAVLPYLGYAKQDKEFLTGEIITISAIAKMLKTVGATKVIVVDFHSPNALKYFKIPIKNISALPLFVKYFKRYKLKDPLVVSPDLFWKNHAEKFARDINGVSAALNKQRDRKTGKIIIKPPFPVVSKGCDLVLFDDMISTGGSIIESLRILNKKKFRKIFVVCTHAVLVGNSKNSIKKFRVNEIISTNSIEGEFSKIDLSDLISQQILNWK
jgi:ribose-phosphate pyrophosphokinase